MKGLKTRAISAVIFVAAIIGGIYGGELPASILMLLICAFSLWEFYELTLQKEEPGFHLRKFIGIFAGLTLLFLLVNISQTSMVPGFSKLPSGIILMTPFVSLLLLLELFSTSKTPYSNVGNLILGLFYVCLPLCLLAGVIFAYDEYRPNILMGIFLLIWSNDTFAYLVGSQFGKNKLFPRISPGKTWEGTIGGGICTLGISFLIAYIFNDLTQPQWLIVAGLCVVFGTLGDLVESMLKRTKGVKDSGNLMPGHGGALDRFDAFLFALPFVCFYLMMI